MCTTRLRRDVGTARPMTDSLQWSGLVAGRVVNVGAEDSYNIASCICRWICPELLESGGHFEGTQIHVSAIGSSHWLAISLLLKPDIDGLVVVKQIPMQILSSPGLTGQS